jgi:hypothetical protein
MLITGHADDRSSLPLSLKCHTSAHVIDLAGRAGRVAAIDVDDVVAHGLQEERLRLELDHVERGEQREDLGDPALVPDNGWCPVCSDPEYARIAMFWSEMHQRAMELALDVYGPKAMLIDAGRESGSWPGAVRALRRAGYPCRR